MRKFNFGDWVRHADDGAANGLVIVPSVYHPRVAWSDGTVDDHNPNDLIIVARSQIKR